MIIKEWRCLASESDWVWMQPWRRWEKRDGSDHISDVKELNACLRRPLEQRSVNSMGVLKLFAEREV